MAEGKSKKGARKAGAGRGAAKKAKPRKEATKPAGKTAKPGTKTAKPRKATKNPQSGKVKLLSGGNPQIPKGEGDGPVQRYIAAMPGWKRDLGRRLDTLIERAVPDVRKAVKWNSPFYGADDESWFLSFHCFTKYVKVTFLRGTSLRPQPSGASKHAHVRYLDIHEGELDEKQFVDWVEQAAELPGERM